MAPPLSLLERSIPGFGPAQDQSLPLADFDGDHEMAMAQTLERTRAFIVARDPVALLALFGRQHLIEAASGTLPAADMIEQSEVELLQTLVLTLPVRSRLPTSPNNFLRCRMMLKDCLSHYAASSRVRSHDGIEALLVHRVRIQTLFYRNAFSSDVGALVVPALLEKIDKPAEAALGYRLSDLARALFSLLQLVGQRLDLFGARIDAILQGVDVETELAELAKRSETIARVLDRTRSRLAANNWPSDAAFQVSEMGWSPVFTFSHEQLAERYGGRVASALFELSIRPGELDKLDLRQAFLSSPIRQRPFIRLSDDRLFIPNPSLIVSFIFEALEYLMRAHPKLLTAYANARASYLPEAVEALVGEALPSAKLYREVKWRDPAGDALYENDVVAVIGHHVFIFEAKAGKLKAAARRGGIDSLKKNLKELFIEPAHQAARLEQLLQSGRTEPDTLVDRLGRPVEIDTRRPVVVRKFGVCLEHFAGLTATRHSYVDLGLLGDGEPWAPILSLGELHMIGTHLDAEPAYFHYLSRRQTIEQQFDFTGDEQDLLSVYLTNRFCLDEDALANVRVVFLGADELARKRKTANPNRQRFEVPGIKLPYLWQRLATEIYDSGNQHRFDMLEVILNQHPFDLRGLQERARRWNRGVSAKEDIAFVRRTIGTRTFGLALAHVGRPPMSEVELGLMSREVLPSVPAADRPSDFLLVVRSRKRASATYDGVHFARLLDRQAM